MDRILYINYNLNNLHNSTIISSSLWLITSQLVVTVKCWYKLLQNVLKHQMCSSDPSCSDSVFHFFKADWLSASARRGRGVSHQTVSLDPRVLYVSLGFIRFAQTAVLQRIKADYEWGELMSLFIERMWRTAHFCKAVYVTADSTFPHESPVTASHCGFCRTVGAGFASFAADRRPFCCRIHGR